ncbi:hypothetical protein HDV04_005318 [Boothiomyces sp. JEL0838]|nr:hypothetical protein HDV04_005318 [Boothiomyces sp. JEL0838]
MKQDKYVDIFYGPKSLWTLDEFLKIIDVEDQQKCKQFESELNSNGKADYEEAWKISTKYNGFCFGIVDEFLKRFHLLRNYPNTFDWDAFGIGFKVPRYQRIDPFEKSKVKEFCEKYRLGDPGYFAGLWCDWEPQV